MFQGIFGYLAITPLESCTAKQQAKTPKRTIHGYLKHSWIGPCKDLFCVAVSKTSDYGSLIVP